MLPPKTAPKLNVWVIVDEEDTTLSLKYLPNPTEKIIQQLLQPLGVHLLPPAIRHH